MFFLCIPCSLFIVLRSSWNLLGLGHRTVVLIVRAHGLFSFDTHIVISCINWPFDRKPCPAQLILRLSKTSIISGSLTIALYSAFVFCFLPRFIRDLIFYIRFSFQIFVIVLHNPTLHLIIVKWIYCHLFYFINRIIIFLIDISNSISTLKW